MNKQYDTVVYIGRFQPTHNAHIETIRRATELARQVVIIVGSAHQPRTYKNPFTSHERELMLRAVTSRLGDPNCAIRIEHNIDTIYNDQAWAKRVQELVAKHTLGDSGKVGIIGYEKDSTSFYLKMFPQWDRIDVELIEPLNATSIRDLYFRSDVNFNFIRGVVPDQVLHFMIEFAKTEDFAQVVREREFIAKYKKQYESLPYAPVFTTADCLVVQSGHVLMIRRRSEPGAQLLALPGGFLNAETDPSVVDCALRELKEETKIKVPLPVLRGNIKSTRVFDAIGRSARGRTITHVCHIELPPGPLPKVAGGDDADKAMWIPTADISPEKCFEDHFEVIQVMCGIG
jgi:bifunctional NMN adenylyltransferase/nudix hydrolase